MKDSYLFHVYSIMLTIITFVCYTKTKNLLNEFRYLFFGLWNVVRGEAFIFSFFSGMLC